MVVEPVKEYFSESIDRIKDKQWPSCFEPKPRPWFPGQDERCIEVPWALSRYRGQRKILEIGLCLADLSLINAQLKLKKLTGCELSGLDIVDLNRVVSRFKSLGVDIRQAYDFHQADARSTGLADNSFDLIFLISTLEHFGFDSFETETQTDSVFKRPNQCPSQFPAYEDCREDRKALKEVARILAPGGSLLLTLPFSGRGICALKDSKGLWALYKEYTLAEWKVLVLASGLTVIDERYFRDLGPAGWVEEKDPKVLSELKGSPCEVTKSIVCAELTKGR